jgi:hypothetical protein
VFRQLAKLGDMVSPLCQCQRMPPTTVIGESVALSDRFRLSVFLDIKAMERAPDAGCEKRARWGYLLPCRDVVGEPRGGSQSFIFYSTSGASDGKRAAKAVLYAVEALKRLLVIAKRERGALMKTLTVALALALGVMATARASAECKDDIERLQAKVVAQQSLRGTGMTDTAPRSGYATAKSWIAKAIDVEPLSEIECLNDLARARRALAAASEASPQDQKGAAQPQGPVPQPEPDARGGASSPKD